MAEWTAEHGFPCQRILLEDRSTTTEENLRFSQQVLAQRLEPGEKIAVVTSNYHAFRAATLMRALGIPGYTVGAPVARCYWLSAMMREFIAVCRDHPRMTVAIAVLSCVPLEVTFLLSVSSLLTQRTTVRGARQYVAHGSAR